MEVGLEPSGLLRITPAVARLGEGRPVVNGTVVEGGAFAVAAQGPEGLRLSYEAPGLVPGRFGLVARVDGSGLRLRYWVEGLPGDVALDSFGLHFGRVENARAFLRSGYTSWDGSRYVPVETRGGTGPDAEQKQEGYGLTQLLPHRGGGSLVAGFERHDRFQHTFTLDQGAGPATLRVLTLWDRKAHGAGARCESEWLLLFTHPEVEGGLRQWAEMVARAAPTPPRLEGPPITGWCSWYNLYAAINEANIRHHLQSAAAVARRDGLPLRVFQIDDGFTPEMGDWLEVKPQFPRGMRPLLDEIRAAGFIPGLWIAPFMVGNRSRLYREHPDWVVGDRQSGGPLAQMQFYGEFRWHKRSEEYYILDTTHPEAMDYLRRVFRTWRRDWGCEYFKTDFMYFGAQHGPDRARRHQEGLTRIEVWRRTAEMIREEIGEALWLGCGSPLWPAIGLVDGIRIGRDMGVKWRGDQSAESLLRDQATRNFTNHVLWQTDPDCVLLRARFHYLSDTEVRSLALFAGMTGGVLMTSDDLEEVPPERLGWLKLLMTERRTTCRFPLLGQPNQAEAGGAAGLDPVVVQVRDGVAGGTGVFVFNTGNAPAVRRHRLRALGLPARGVVDGEGVEEVEVRLEGHEGRLLVVRQDEGRTTRDEGRWRVADG